jgi:serine/threonine-protein kinase
MEGSSPLRPGDRVAERYVVERELAHGGMGVVYVATHTDLGTEVAIKVLTSGHEDPTLGARFLREARAAARLKSEHITRVFDFGVLPSGLPFMVLELLTGVDVDAVLELGPIPPQVAVGHVLQACEGLAVAHAAGLVHRDIKPSNLFVTTRSDGSPLIKILDFGIAKDVSDSKKTTGGMGSPYYMSPEQVRAAADVDARTDVWALGVTLFEMLSGERPFEGVIASQVCIAIVNDEPVRLDAVTAGLPPELVATVHRCLAKNRDERPANVGELAMLLAPFATYETRLHAERAVRTLGGRSSMTSVPDGDRLSFARNTPSRPLAGAARAGAETMPALSSRPPPPPPTTRRFVIAGLVGVAALGVVATVLLLVRGPTLTATGAPSAGGGAAVVVSAASASAVVAPSTTLSTATASASSPPSAITAAVTGAAHRPAPTTKKPTPAAPASATTSDGTEDRN